MFPVDLPDVDISDLTSASELCLACLESGPQDDEVFRSSQTSQVVITASNVRRLQLFEDEQPDCTLLALHPPGDPTQVAALYLHGEWWRVEDVLRTSCESRSGLMPVQTLMERVIVFLLSQVVDASWDEGGVLFALHPRTESCKLLWRDGQAVGFYSIKHKGTLCDGWSGHSYLLPVLDTVLVRKTWTRRGFGLQMLEDFCSSFKTEEFLGVSSPLSPSMAAVCRKFLQEHEEHRERLYEVEAPGGWAQRRNIWLSIRLGRHSLRVNEKRSPTSGDFSSQKMQTCSCRLTPRCTCDVHIPADAHSSEEQIKSSDASRGGSSPSSEISGTGCSPAAHSEGLDSGPPTRPPRSHSSKQALISKPSLSAEHSREKPDAEEIQGSPKRRRRT